MERVSLSLLQRIRSRPTWPSMFLLNVLGPRGGTVVSAVTSRQGGRRFDSLVLKMDRKNLFVTSLSCKVSTCLSKLLNKNTKLTAARSLSLVNHSVAAE